MDIFFLTTLIIVISEMIISGTWQPFYFTFGIPLYKKSFAISETPFVSPEDLSSYFGRSNSTPIIFQQLSDQKIAFRESFLSFRLMSYTPIMHGLIRYDLEKIEITGLANWFPLLFTVFFVIAGSELGGPWKFNFLLALFPIGLCAFLYVIQLVRFNELYEILLKQHK